MHRVLVVDADPAAIYILNNILKTEFNVTIVTGANEALRKIVETNSSVLIINIDMPGIDCPELLKATFPLLSWGDETLFFFAQTL